MTQEIDPLSPKWTTHFWRSSLAGEVPLADVVADGTTAVAYGVRGDVLYVMDVYEVEASNAIPPDSSRTFRPLYLARPVSHWPLIIVFAVSVCTVICASVMACAVLGAFSRVPI